MPWHFQALVTLHSGQLTQSAGRENDFDLEQYCACKGVKPSLHAVSPDIFVILPPRPCQQRVLTLSAGLLRIWPNGLGARHG